MEEEIRFLKKEVETLKTSKEGGRDPDEGGRDPGLPFQVDEKDKTVLLVGWNLKILADLDDKGPRWPKNPADMPKCKEDCGKGNLIVGKRHKYSGAVESFFSGIGHSAEGYGNGFLGGVYNKAATVENSFNAFAGGETNSASGKNGFIGGGRHSKLTSKYSATVIGGRTNTASVDYSVVVGGEDNLANEGGIAGVIVGGSNNRMQSYNSVILGGDHNVIKHGASGVVMGGFNNTLRNGANKAFIVGGDNNMIMCPICQSNGIVGGEGNLLDGWALDRANLVIGGNMTNATWKTSPKREFEIVPITWKTASAE